MKKLLLSTFLLLILVNVNSQTLIAHYPLDGNGIDVSGNSLNGTETNLTAADDKDGNAGMATEFLANSSIDVYDTAAFNLGLEGSRTLSYWYKTTSTTTYNGIFCNGTGAWYSGMLTGLNWGDAGNLLFACGAEGFGGLPNVAAVSTTNGNMNDGAWHHVVGVIDGVNNLMYLYIDGVKTKIKKYSVFGATGGTLNSDSTELDLTGVGYKIIPSTGFTGIGKTPYGQQFYGTLDELFVYGDVLSASDIGSLNNGTPIGVESENIDQPKDFQLAPNPSNGIIDIKNNSVNSYNLIINDITGKVVYEKTITGLWKTIDLSFLPKGIYLANLQYEVISNTKKIILE